MDHTEPSFDTGHALELRVLAGLQAGARAPLACGAACLLAAGAHSDGHVADIVLRDDAAGPVRVRITAGAGQALVEVTCGGVTLGDKPLASGDAAVWAMHAPLRIGASVVAFGRADEPVWPDAPTEPPAAAAQAPLEPATAPVPKRRAPPWLVPAGVVLALASAGLLGLVNAVSAERPVAAQGVTLAAALQGSEFASLATAQDASGQPELRGRLATLVQRTRLDAWLAARQFTPVVNVQVDEAIARDVTDVFRVNGVAVQARVQGPGRIVAEASEPDAERLARAEEVVRRDVRGLDQLSVINRALPKPPPAPPVVDDPGKRIASLVPGDPAYLVTADGAHYFVGALLPSGHRITQIVGQRVTLERDGQASTLNL
jgi:type III secretion protein D